MDENIPTEKKKLAWVENAVKKGCTTLAPTFTTKKRATCTTWFPKELCDEEFMVQNQSFASYGYVNVRQHDHHEFKQSNVCQPIWKHIHSTVVKNKPFTCISDIDIQQINVAGPDGWTPLMLASSYSHSSAMVRELIHYGADLHAQTHFSGETSLHLAARYGQVDAVKQLLDEDANPNSKDKSGRTPLHAAVAADAQDVIEILFKNRKTNLNSQMNDGTTPLILAVRLLVEDTVDDLMNLNAKVNAADKCGKTALHWAALVNNTAAITVLLEHNANKDAQNYQGETPLFLAAREGNYETAKVLLDQDANKNIMDNMNQLPQDVAQKKKNEDIVMLLEMYPPSTIEKRFT